VDLRRYAPVFLISLAVYLAVGGSLSLPDVAMGIAVSAVVSAVSTPMLVSDPAKATSPARLAKLLAFALYYFTVAEARAHFSVVRTILTGKPPLSPSIVRVPYRSSSDYALAASANSITNTPGTVVVDVDRERGLMYVHWLYAEKTDEEWCYEKVLAPFEKRLREVFD